MTSKLAARLRQTTGVTLSSIHMSAFQTIVASLLILFRFDAFALEAVLTDDAIVNSKRPNTNYASGRMLGLRNGQPVYLNFDLSLLPLGVTSLDVNKATLKIWTDRVVQSGSFCLSPVLVAWKEETLTFRNQPGIGPAEISGISVDFSARKKFLTMDVTAIVRDWVDGVQPNYGVALVPDGDLKLFALFSSKEDLGTGHLPELEILLKGAGIGAGSPLDAGQIVTGTIPNSRLDSELSALAQVSSSPDQLPYFSGVGTATTTPLSSAARSILDEPDVSAMRNALGAQDRSGTTPLVHRRLQTGDNLRVLIFGDSIAYEPLAGDRFGVLRLLQDQIGNAGAGGVNVGAEQIQYFDGPASYASDSWFRPYVSISAGGAYEFALGFPARGRRSADCARVTWRTPIGVEAQFLIETCSDADGEGQGSWVVHGGVRTAPPSSSAVVDHTQINLGPGSYRLRVRCVTGSINVVNMELSHSGMGGVVINNHAHGGSAFRDWANLPAHHRKAFIESVKPDVVFVFYKDDAPTMAQSLVALWETRGATSSEGFPWDVVLLSPFPSLPVHSPNWISNYEQREVMRQWAITHRVAYVDLWDLMPIDPVYLSDNTHLSGTVEQAHLAQLILERLGWTRYPSLSAKANPTVKTVHLDHPFELPNAIAYSDVPAARIALDAGTWRLSGRWLFTNDGSAGEGGKILLEHTSQTAVMKSVEYSKLQGNSPPISVLSPFFGGHLPWPLEMVGQIGGNANFGYRLESLDLVVNAPGFLKVRAAKENLGGPVLLREGSFLRAERVR
jgi:hypothetical protein